MKKLIAGILLCFVGAVAHADPVTVTPPAINTAAPSPLESVTNQFAMSFLSHVSAVDSFRQDGTHVVKFADGIIQAVPYKGDHLIIGSFGLIPNPADSTKFYKSYSIHAHLIGFLSQYININPTYGDILSQFDFSPGYTYDTDERHGGFSFDIGYVKSF